MQAQEKGKASEFKQKWFDFTKQLSSNELSISLYKLFIVIESLQFLGYHNNGLIHYNTYGFEQLGKGLQFLNLLPMMLERNVNYLLVPIFTVITMGHVGLIVMGYKAYHRKMEKMSKSVEDRNFHKNRLEYFINFIMVCLNTFLTIPICQTSVTAIYCQSTAPYTAVQDCYSTTQLCIAILATFNLIWLLLSNFYFALYYYDRNPFSTNFLTCSSNWWNLGKFAIKITPMLYFLYDAELAYPVLFLVVINACYIGYVGVFRVLFPYYRYNFNLEKFIYFTEALVLCVNVHFVAVFAIKGGALSQKKSYVFVFWVAGSVLLARLALKYLISQKEKLITEVNSVQKAKLELVLEYIIYLIFQVEKGFTSNQNAFYLANVAKTHKEHCENLQCYCLKYFARVKDKNAYKNKEVFYTLLLAIVDRVIGQNKKAYPFFILKAYILYYKMQSQIKAATTIAMIMQDKLDFSDEMLVKGLLFELNHQYVDTRDMQVYRKFNEYLLKQEEQSLKLVNYYLQYWQELIDQNSSIPKLHRLLVNIKQSKDQLGEIVQGSLAIYRNHVRVLLLYRNFLKEVLNDYVGYLRYEEKYKIGLKEHKLSNVDAVNTIQFRANQNLLVINFTRHFSAHSEILGNFKILSISSNVKQFLGFTNAQLKDQSLNKLIPRIYHSVHDAFVDRILDRRDSEITSRQFRIFPVNSQGYIIQCNVISKFMPSVVAGINIVSFIQQCDRNKDEFFIIYDGSTGMVDSMNQDAEKMLKDVSRRKTNDMLAIPDHINDLLPNWDYRNEVWREHLGRGKSLKSIASSSDFKYEVREIEVSRSDGLDVKNIKVLKFKGDFFVRMFSFENYESYKESNTIQQYLDYQKESAFSKMDSNQLQDLISVETHNLIQRDREKKKTIKKMIQKNEKTRYELIEPDPPKPTKICFIVIQAILFCLALGFIIYQFVISNHNIDTYMQDCQLIIYMNDIQLQLSDSTYILSLVASLMAYESNMTLPFPNFKSTIELLPEMQEVDEKYEVLNERIHTVNNIFVGKINKGELAQGSLGIVVKYLLQPKEKKYYLQQTDLMQALLQYVSYGQQLSYRIVYVQQPIQILLDTPDYFFINANNIDILPKKLLSIKMDIINSINSSLNSGFTEFLIIKIINAILIVISAMGILVYKRYIYKHYVLRVLEMYENIRIDQIRVFQEKCNRYKASLSDKGELERSKSGENENENSRKELRQDAMEEVDQSVVSESVFNAEEEESKLAAAAVPEAVQHFLTFQELPKQSMQILTLIVWLLLYGILLFALCYTYSQGTDTLQSQILNLNKYSNVLDSVVQMRLFSQLSLNMLNYWDDDYLKSINTQLQDYFTVAVQFMDDKGLNLTAVHSQFARKYQEMRYLQYLVLKKDTATMDVIIGEIQYSLQEIDALVQLIAGQSALYLPVVTTSSQKIRREMNLCIGLELVFILAFWYFAVRLAYLQLLKEHRSTYEMYNIISYNLRKEVEKV